MVPPFVEKLRATPIARKLRLQETFPAADAAKGSFRPNSLQDDARLDRTSSWVNANCQGLWRRTVRRSSGYVRFDFETLADADAFRKVSASMPGMIPCR